jgi:hypothetical protein
MRQGDGPAASVAIGSFAIGPAAAGGASFAAIVAGASSAALSVGTAIDGSDSAVGAGAVIHDPLDQSIIRIDTPAAVNRTNRSTNRTAGPIASRQVLRDGIENGWLSGKTPPRGRFCVCVNKASLSPARAVVAACPAGCRRGSGGSKRKSIFVLAWPLDWPVELAGAAARCETAGIRAITGHMFALLRSAAGMSAAVSWANQSRSITSDFSNVFTLIPPSKFPLEWRAFRRPFRDHLSAARSIDRDVASRDRFQYRVTIQAVLRVVADVLRQDRLQAASIAGTRPNTVAVHRDSD